MEEKIIEQFSELIDKQDELTADSVITNQRKSDLDKIKSDQNFIDKSYELNTRDIASKINEDANIVWSRENKNKLEEYRLRKEIQQLDFRAEKEKKLIKAEVEADVYKKKLEIFQNKYGYLYETKTANIINKDGVLVDTVVYKDFTCSKFINRTKQFERWYKNLSDSTKKIIKHSLKIGFWLLIAFLIIFSIYKGFRFLMDKDILNILAQLK